MKDRNRKGAVSILVLVLLTVMFAVGIFAVDYGYLLVMKTELQRAADHAALAAVRDLVPDSSGTQDYDRVKESVREYTFWNLENEEFVIDDSDIETGRFDPSTVYSNFVMLQSGLHDTVKVTLRRDDLNNGSVTLYLARLFGIENMDVSATSTAVLQKAQFLLPGTDILPIAIPEDTWNTHTAGQDWSIYGDGRLVDSNGNEVPGNWGTLDVGASSNANSNIVDQINDGLSQQDLDHLASDGTIPTNTHIDGNIPIWLNGDPGFSAGMKDAVTSSHGQTKLIPIFSETNSDPNGGNLDFHVVGWGVVEIVDSFWQGNKNSNITIRKSYSYDGDLRPNRDLGNTSDVIAGAFTAPVLVQ